MSPWIHLSSTVHKYSYVLCKYTKVSTKLMYVHVNKCTVCELRSSAPLPPQRDVGIRYGCSHCSHSLSIEIIEKNSLHEFFCTFHYANKHK